MRGEAADDPADLPSVAGAHGHSVRGQDSHIPPAQGSEVQETVLIDVVDEQADLVHVGVEHHGEIRLPVSRHQKISKHVGADVVSVGGHECLDGLPCFILKSGRTECVGQRLESSDGIHESLTSKWYGLLTMSLRWRNGCFCHWRRVPVRHAHWGARGCREVCAHWRATRLNGRMIRVAK